MINWADERQRKRLNEKLQDKKIAEILLRKARKDSLQRSFEFYGPKSSAIEWMNDDRRKTGQATQKTQQIDVRSASGRMAFNVSLCVFYDAHWTTKYRQHIARIRRIFTFASSKTVATSSEWQRPNEWNK